MPSEISLDLIESFMGPLSTYIALDDDEGDRIWTLVLREGSAEIKRRSWAEIAGLADEEDVQRSRAMADGCPSAVKPIVVICPLCPRPGCKLVHAHLFLIVVKEENHGQEAGQLPV